MNWYKCGMDCDKVRIFAIHRMMIKDYYKILEVAPQATQQEIRKSFRRLALQYHPDKNAGSSLAEAQFREIQEAYEVLSDEKSRKEYNYKRWYNRSIGQEFVKRPLTPADILHESKLLLNYVHSMTIFRVDYDALSYYMRQLITDGNIGLLQQYNDVAANKAIIQTLLQATAPLPMLHLIPITHQLLILAGNDMQLAGEIHRSVKERKQREAWDKYKWIVMVVITGVICWLMYWYGK
jgi:molecular chaperone DnaJ